MNRFVALACAGIALAGGAYFVLQPGLNMPAGQIVAPANAQEAEVDTSTIVEMTMGDPNAPVKVIEYASYTCPHCARFHEGPFKQLKSEFIDTGKVHFTYREVYFDRYGLWASMVARCNGPDQFFGITDMLYDQQSDWTRAGGAPEIADALRKIGGVAGIEKDTLEACMQDGTKAQTLVSWYQDNANADGITSTPSFMVNGDRVPNQSYEEFKALLERELGE
ncbi:MAG: DsbA family protein [Pseudomonadota bacterium]